MAMRLLTSVALGARLLSALALDPLDPIQGDEEYEYIVVGSGAGGGTLAARLALNGQKTLLIEAGDDQGANQNLTVPSFHPYSTEDETMRWDFWVNHYTKEEEAKKDSKMTWTTPSGDLYYGKSPPAGSKMKGILYPRSGTLGGCTAHNAMAAVYPHDSDWSYIANLTGDKSWDPNVMRKLWERLEHSEYAKPGSPGHGFNGSLHTSIPPVTMAAEDPRLLQIGITSAKIIGKTEAEVEKNIERVTGGDLNSPEPGRDRAEGVWLLPLTISHDNEKKKGTRSGSREIVLSVLNAKNADGSKKYPLTLALETLATKVIFDETKTKPKAVGVEVMKGKSLYRADPRAKLYAPKPNTFAYRATKEVILSGGAYNTPQLLKLSGIGPKSELSRFNIPVRADLPGVGTNLQDHFEIGHTATVKNEWTVIAKCTAGKSTDPCLEDWRQGKGVYGDSNGFIFGVIKRSSVATEDSVFGNDPDLIIFGGVAAFRGYYPGYASDVYQHNAWTWVVLKAYSAQNAGTVTLVSKDPRDPPRIDSNYFDSKGGAGKRDLIAMAEGIDLARKITFNVTDSSADIGWNETLPGNDKPFPSKALDDHIKAEAWSHHASCTCPIGADEDKMAVLDSKFRVRGVAGLRVVDASVFPRIPGYFIAVPTYIIGEKAAESILKGL